MAAKTGESGAPGHVVGLSQLPLPQLEHLKSQVEEVRGLENSFAQFYPWSSSFYAQARKNAKFIINICHYIKK